MKNYIVNIIKIAKDFEILKKGLIVVIIFSNTLFN